MFKCIVGIMIGVAFLICAASAASYTNDFLNSSVVVSGRVVGLDNGRNHPLIEFVTQKGEHISRIQSGFIPALNMDDYVPIRYRPDAPLQTARLDYFLPIWGPVLVLVFFGLAFSVGSIVTFILTKTSKKSRERI
jgi:hypothetical protein